MGPEGEVGEYVTEMVDSVCVGTQARLCPYLLMGQNKSNFSS